VIKNLRQDQQTRVLEILGDYGRCPIARFTFFEDKSYFISAGGSVVVYSKIGRAAIALGNPIGPIHDSQACIVEFSDICKRDGLSPVFYQTTSAYLSEYQSAGFEVMCIGQDAIINLPAFNLDGSARKNIRNSFHKMRRGGYQVQVSQLPHPPALLHELRQVSAAWIAKHGGIEIGFSLGQLNENYVNTHPLILSRGPDGGLEAFVNVIIEAQSEEAALDLMRYCPGSKNGQMDFLFVSVLLWAKQSGLKTFNLGFSPLTGVGKGPQASGVERLVHFFHTRLAHFPNFSGLQFFKNKFAPTWSPRYLAYTGLKSLPLAALGLMRGYKVGRLFASYLSHRL